MELGFNFDDGIFEESKKKSQLQLTSFRAKQCEPEWFLAPDISKQDVFEMQNAMKFQADLCYRQGKFEKAIKLYTQIRANKKYKCSTTVERELAESMVRCLMKLKRIQQAEELVRDMLEDQLEDASLWYLLAQVNSHSNEVQDEIGALHKCITLHSFNYNFWWELAVANIKGYRMCICRRACHSGSNSLCGHTFDQKKTNICTLQPDPDVTKDASTGSELKICQEKSSNAYEENRKIPTSTNFDGVSCCCSGRTLANHTGLNSNYGASNINNTERMNNTTSHIEHEDQLTTELASLKLVDCQSTDERTHMSRPSMCEILWTNDSDSSKSCRMCGHYQSAGYVCLLRARILVKRCIWGSETFIKEKAQAFLDKIDKVLDDYTFCCVQLKSEIQENLHPVDEMDSLDSHEPSRTRAELEEKVKLFKLRWFSQASLIVANHKCGHNL